MSANRIINLEDKNINYTLEISKRSKRMRIAVYCDGNMVVTIPRNINENIIENFMIAANGVTARYLSSKKFPSIRRVVRTPKRWDRIVEIAFKKITNDGKERQSTTILNPEIPIPKEATDKHGILDETVKSAKTFKEISVGLAEFLKGADFAGFSRDGVSGNAFSRVRRELL